MEGRARPEASGHDRIRRETPVLRNKPNFRNPTLHQMVTTDRADRKRRGSPGSAGRWRDGIKGRSRRLRADCDFPHPVLLAEQSRQPPLNAPPCCPRPRFFATETPPFPPCEQRPDGAWPHSPSRGASPGAAMPSARRTVGTREPTGGCGRSGCFCLPLFWASWPLWRGSGAAFYSFPSSAVSCPFSTSISSAGLG